MKDYPKFFIKKIAQKLGGQEQAMKFLVACMDKAGIPESQAITEEEFVKVIDYMEAEAFPKAKKTGELTMMHLGLGVAGGAVRGFVLGKMIK